MTTKRTAASPMAEHIAAFLAAKKLAPKSKKDYARYLCSFDEFTGHVSLKAGLKLDNAAQWVEEMRTHGQSVGHNGSQYLKSFATWVAKSRAMVMPGGGSALLGLESPKVAKGSRNCLTDAQLAAIASCMERRDTGDRRRAKAYLWLLYATGLRKSEARQIALADVHLDLEGSRSWVHVRAETSKGMKERRVRLDRAAVPAIAAYIGTRPKYVGDPEKETLFLTIRGTPFTDWGFSTWTDQIFQYIRKETGIRASSHWFRHTWATQFHRASRYTGLTVYDMMREGGWSNPQIPLTYTHDRPWDEVLDTQTHISALAEHKKVG